MATPALRHDIVDTGIANPAKLPASEYNLNAVRTDAAYDVSLVAYKPGGTDVAIADGGTGASTPVDARNNLGLGPLATLNPTGTKSSATFLRGDDTYAVPPGGTGGSGYTPGGTDVAITDGGTGVSSLPTGLLKGAGVGAIAAGVPGTDFYAPGSTDVPIADGGTGASTALAARNNLGLGTLATLTPTGTASATTYLNGAGAYSTPAGGGGGSESGIGTVTITGPPTAIGQVPVALSGLTTASWQSIAAASGALAYVAGATTDPATDTAAIQAAHDSLPPQGGIILLPVGYYSLTPAGITISKPVIFQGSGYGNMAGSGGTLLLQNATNATGITLSAGSEGSVLRDFLLYNQFPNPTSGAGILVNTGNMTRYEGVIVFGYLDGLDMVAGMVWTIASLIFNTPRRYGIRVRHTGDPDFGDFSIWNTKFLMENGSFATADPAAAIRWETSSGCRISDCKVNWASPTSYRYNIGIDVAFTGNLAKDVADIFIHDNSIENCRTAGIKLSRTVGTQKVTGTLIRGNEFMNIPTFVDVGVGFDQVIIDNNVGMGTGTTAAVVVNASATPPIIGNNSWSGLATEVTGPHIRPAHIVPIIFGDEVASIGGTASNRAYDTRTLTGARMRVATAPVGSALTVQVQHSTDGTTWTNVGSALSIAAGSTTEAVQSFTQLQTVGHLVRLNVTSVGSTTPAGGMAVDVIYR